jgi:hypothetical protein
MCANCPPGSFKTLIKLPRNVKIVIVVIVLALAVLGRVYDIGPFGHKTFALPPASMQHIDLPSPAFERS